MLLRSTYIISCFVFASSVMGQKQFNSAAIWNMGSPLIQNYTASEYGGNPQNWCSIEGNNGYMYFGNTSGIIEFDGIRWRFIPLSNQSIVYSLGKTEDGTIYIGGVGEIGRLISDETGGLEYESLMPNVDSKFHDFAEVSYVVTKGNVVFFGSRKHQFKWDGKHIQLVGEGLSFTGLFRAQDKIWATGKNGIHVWNNRTFELVNTENFFDGNKGRVMDMLTLPDGEILTIHSKLGLIILKDLKVHQWENTATQLINEIAFYDAHKLANGDLLLAATLEHSGLYHYSIDDQAIRLFSTKDGLISNTINNIYQSSDGGVWLSTDKGISKVDLISPLRKFDERHGLTERVRSLAYKNGKLFAGVRGVMVMDETTNDMVREIGDFQPIRNIDGTVRSLTITDNQIFAVQTERIYSITDDLKASLLIDAKRYVSSLASKFSETDYYVGGHDGQIYAASNIKQRWNFNSICDIQTRVGRISEDDQGHLWISTDHKGIFKVDISLNSGCQIEVYDTLKGLPDNTYNIAIAKGSDVLVSTQYGLYTLDPIADTFMYNSRINDQYNESVWAYGPMAIADDGSIWQTVLDARGNKIYKIENQSLTELESSNLFTDFKSFHIYEANGVVYFAGPDGIIAYNTAKDFSQKEHADVPILHYVSLKDDSLAYAGMFNKTEKHVFSFEQNEMTFEYSYPFFNQPDETRFQYQLVGYDNDWSEWISENKKEYTNLSEGDYKFQIRAQNVFEDITEPDVFHFSITPPWHRSLVAFVGYALLALLGIYLLDKWRSRSLARKNRELESVIADRTSEINEKNILLEKQTEKLQQLDEIKTQFFANISHEFRTPLTLIKGPIEQLEKNPNDQLSVTNVKMIRRNANRLLRLVNQLLDISKLDAQKLKLEMSEGNMFNCLRAAASSFSSHAAQRNMDYQVNIPSRKLWASFDRDKLEKIIYNLLSNAFKYTPDESKVIFSAQHQDGLLRLKVIDSGIGISKAKQQLIFDRFFQADQGKNREGEGTGIGLALTKELVELMHGRIDVDSSIHEGSSFVIKIPIEEIKSEVEQYGSHQAHERQKDTSIKQAESIANDISSGKALVLIIEDNIDMRHYIRQHLAGSYSVVEAYNGLTGLEKAKRVIPDLIITDLMMPQMDGMTLSENLRQSEVTSHIPIIMLTAKAGFDSKIMGLEKGADVYLTKPFEMEELKMQIKKLIVQREKLRAHYSRQAKTDPRKISINSVDELFFKKTMALMETQYMDGLFGVQDMQESLGMSKTQLHRKIKAITDLAPGELLRNYRIKRSEQLLRQRADSVSQIALMVGFNNASHFAQSFKKYYGMSPSEYLKQL